MVESEQSFEDTLLPQNCLDVNRFCNLAVTGINEFLQPPILPACEKLAEGVVNDDKPLAKPKLNLREKAPVALEAVNFVLFTQLRKVRAIFFVGDLEPLDYPLDRV